MRLISIGDRITTKIFTCSAKAEAKAETFTAPPPSAAEASEESEQESDVELDLLDTVLQPDNDASQEMGDENKEATEEEMDQASELRGKAAKAYSNGDYEGKTRSLAPKLSSTNALLTF